MMKAGEGKSPLPPDCFEDRGVQGLGAGSNSAGTGEAARAGAQTGADLIGSMKNQIKLHGDILTTAVKWDSEG
jgi:hypothetical protein